MHRWEFIKENKKVRKNENTLSTKKAIKKKEKNTLLTKKKVRKRDLDHAIEQEKKTSFKILLFFFYKFPPQSGTSGPRSDGPATDA